MRLTLSKILRPILLFVIGCSSGCGTRVVMVPAGDPVRIAEPVRAAVWVRDDSGTWIKADNKVELPAGWYALSDPREAK